MLIPLLYFISWSICFWNTSIIFLEIFIVFLIKTFKFFVKNISLFQLLGSFFIKFLFCPFISAHYNTLFGKSNQSYCDKNIFICVFYIKQYFYYVFIFFQLFFILFSDFCNADSSYVSYNVFLRWHVIIHEITVIFLLITCHTAFFSMTRNW